MMNDTTPTPTPATPQWQAPEPNWFQRNKKILIALAILIVISCCCLSIAVNNRAPSAAPIQLPPVDSPQQPPVDQQPPVVVNTPPAQFVPNNTTTIISPEKDWKRVVYDGANRIWQDQLLPESGRPAFDCSFTAPFGGAAVFNGVNAELWLDSNKDGTPDTLIASKGNSISIVLIQDGWYKVVNGPFNGGFEILR